MSKKKKIFHKAIFIACEGRSTEKNYFQLIGETFGEELNYALTVYPDENEVKPKSDPIGLIKEAISRKDDGFDELWAVFDKDGYTKHEEAFQLAKDKGINVAFSSIAFEEWILLHFERNIYAFNKSDCKDENDKYVVCGTNNHVKDCEGKNCVGGYIRKKNYYPDYSKSSERSIYSKISDKTEVAILNSAWLRFQLKKEIQNCNGKIFNINPFTNIDYLVKRLVGIDKNHFYSSFDEIIYTEWFSFTAHLNNNQIKINFENKTNNLIVFNQNNIDNFFECQGNNIEIDKTYCLEPNHKDILMLKISGSLQHQEEVVFKWNNYIFHIIY